jgi:hypothetical protein
MIQDKVVERHAIDAADRRQCQQMLAGISRAENVAPVGRIVQTGSGILLAEEVARPSENYRKALALCC